MTIQERAEQYAERHYPAFTGEVSKAVMQLYISRKTECIEHYLAGYNEAAKESSKLSRIEVINHYENKGRDYVKWVKANDFKITLDYQDNDRTLKIFIEKQ